MVSTTASRAGERICKCECFQGFIRDQAEQEEEEEEEEEVVRVLLVRAAMIG